MHAFHGKCNRDRSNNSKAGAVAHEQESVRVARLRLRQTRLVAHRTRRLARSAQHHGRRSMCLGLKRTDAAENELRLDIEGNGVA